jgi:hypothetical protein
MITKNGETIRTMEDWHRLAHPAARDLHWKAGRSAMETARAWLASPASELPPEVTQLLKMCPDFGSVVEWNAEPEVELRFDGFAGNGRYTDLLVDALDSNGRFLIAVEAKADESFGPSVRERLAAAMKEKVARPTSNAEARVRALCRDLFQGATPEEEAIGSIRYQLLIAVAGALAEAGRRSSRRVVLLVQEFVTSATDDRLHARNRDDLDSFVRRLSLGTVEVLGVGKLSGPIHLQTVDGLGGYPALYVGKVVRNLRA